MKTKLYMSYRSNDGRVELTYSFFHFLSGNPVWFCRVWDGFKIKGESYGKNKFESYRLASNK